MYRSFLHTARFHILQKDRPVFRFAFLAFLFAIASGLISFTLPVLLQREKVSLALIGLILASSSIWNIATDLVIGFLKKPPNYRWLFQMIGLAIVAIFASLWLYDEVIIIIMATVLWGIFTEFYNFANFDFVVNNCQTKQQGVSFGTMANFRCLGYFIAPIMAGSLLLANQEFVLLAGLFLGLLILILLKLYFSQKKLPKPIAIQKRRMPAAKELALWFKIIHKVFPLLLVFMTMGICDGILSSFAPLFVMDQPNLRLIGGFIVAMLSLPTMLLTGYFGRLADKKGEKPFILLGLLVSGASLLFFGYAQEAFVAIVLALVIGIGYSIYMAALQAEQSHYIEKHHVQENEVVGESGIFYNLGFFGGAALAGVLAEVFGSFGPMFAVFGVMHFVVVEIYFLFGPKARSLVDGKFV
ncbi:MFS transporter [Candidatus Beckwithbacteria bacterium]|nr:MFS transporter [Candidatus Beckwithbacteria bacterium]